MKTLLAAALMLAAFTLHAAPESGPADGPALAVQVREIFHQTCVECHGSDLAKPKKKFGYVLDLARVAANPKMIVRGDPDESDLYGLIEDDEMPGDDAKSGPLTAQEKEIVRRWILAGAPPPPVVAAIPAAKPRPPQPLPFRKRLLRAIGQFHPPSAHFPIALLFTAALAEVMWHRTRKRSWQAAVRMCVGLGAVAACATASLGWANAAVAGFRGDSAVILEWHRWLGTATAAWAVLAAVVSEITHTSRRFSRGRAWFRVVLIVGVLLVGAAGFAGSALIYGLNHYRW